MEYIQSPAKSCKKLGFTLMEILVVLGIISLLATIVIVAINPSKQFAQARNTQRTSHATAILDAIGQYIADNQGSLPTGINYNRKEIGKELCSALVPTYIAALPTDPQSDNEGMPIKDDDCANIAANDIGYHVEELASGRVTIYAPNAELEEEIEITR